MSALQPGQNAPDFSLPADNGDTVSLASFAGKKAVLYFYPKDDTKGCTLESIDFSRLKKDFETAGAVILGISPDSISKHEKFKKKHDLNVILAADEAQEMLSAYGVWQKKSMYGREYMGVVRTTVLLDEAGKILKIWPKVKVNGHAEEVLEAVKAAS